MLTYRNDGLLCRNLASTGDGMVIDALPSGGILHGFNCRWAALAVSRRRVALAEVEPAHDVAVVEGFESCKMRNTKLELLEPFPWAPGGLYTDQTLSFRCH